MRQKILIRVCALVFTALLILGIVFRFNLKDTYDTEAGREKMKVALLNSEMEEMCRFQSKLLDKSKIILTGRATGNSEFCFDSLKQEVEVTHAVRGEGEDLVGKKISLISNALRGDFFKENEIDINFINYMQKGDEYLIFIKKQAEPLGGEDTPVYLLAETVSMYYLNLSRDESYVCDRKEIYIPYKDVKNSEFFVRDEKILKVLQEIKGQMIKKYVS